MRYLWVGGKELDIYHMYGLKKMLASKKQNGSIWSLGVLFLLGARFFSIYVKDIILNYKLKLLTHHLFMTNLWLWLIRLIRLIS